MSFTYTSRDAYNSCLSLYSPEEAEHRGYYKSIKITGSVNKTTSGYVFNISKISTIDVHAPRLPTIQSDTLDLKTVKSSTEYHEYTLPPFNSAKIILTTDESLFSRESSRPRFNVTLQISNFDFSDLTTWPPLVSCLSGRAVTQTNDSCSVSLGDSWSLCDSSSDVGSEFGEWELISMEAVGADLQKMALDLENHGHLRMSSEDVKENVASGHAANSATISGHHAARLSYAQILMKPGAKKSMSAESSSQNFRQEPRKRKKWEPVIQVQHVRATDRQGLYCNTIVDYILDDEDDCRDDLKSFGSTARSNMLIANENFQKLKTQGIVHVKQCISIK